MGPHVKRLATHKSHILNCINKEDGEISIKKTVLSLIIN